LSKSEVRSLHSQVIKYQQLLRLVCRWCVAELLHPECVGNLEFIEIMLAAVGCSDLAPPSDAAWLKRVDDQITIGCYMSRQSWQLNCVNGVWTGTVGVCSQAVYDEQGQYKSRYIAKTPYLHWLNLSCIKRASKYD
jgi:hypothetical protein